jgi:hypothetical protein
MSINKHAGGKQPPAISSKKEIQIKKNPTAEAIRRAPDEVIAKAIHDAILKDKGM